MIDTKVYFFPNIQSKRKKKTFFRAYREGDFYFQMPIFVSDTPLSPMGPSSPSQEGLFTDLRLLSLEKQLNIELKVDIVSSEKKKKNGEREQKGWIDKNKFDSIISSPLRWKLII